MKCPCCGNSFYVSDAREEFEDYFDYDLVYDDLSPRMCGDCAIDYIRNRIEEDEEEW